jgi:RNA polymerase-binding transcription factor DksA
VAASRPSPSHGSATRQRLRTEHEALEGQVRALEAQFERFVEASELVATDDEHDPEGHTIAFERQQVAGLLRAARLRRAAVEDALDRLEKGTYGRCAACGRPIQPERLEALPSASCCRDCAD